jgi:hypothetical protein
MVFANVPFPVARDLCGKASNVRRNFGEKYNYLRSADPKTYCIPEIEPMHSVVGLYFDLNSIGNAAKEEQNTLRRLRIGFIMLFLPCLIPLYGFILGSV